MNRCLVLDFLIIDMELSKYETLSRVRGNRVLELEDVVVKLNQAVSASEQENSKLRNEVKESLALIENLIAENRQLKIENKTVIDLRRQIEHERDISNRLEREILQKKKPIFFAPVEAPLKKIVHVSVQTDFPHVKVSDSPIWSLRE